MLVGLWKRRRVLCRPTTIGTFQKFQAVSRISTQVAISPFLPTIFPTLSLSPIPMSISRRGLVWDDSGLNLEPRWENEPDLEKIRNVCQQTLQAKCSVSFLAEGAFNRVYLVEADNNKKCIMRVSLPVDPQHKTAGEVATLDWLNNHSNMPVPRVMASDSTRNNEIGFEWIMMKLIPGSSARHRWRKASMDDKKILVERMAGYHAHLMNTSTFQGIGTLKIQNSQPVPDRKSSMMLFWGSHFDFDIPRGPFRSSYDWLQSYVSIIIKEEAEEIAAATDEEEREDAERKGRIARKLDQLLPKIFSATQDLPERTVIWHDDLGLQNIMLDEKNSLTGIIDWECVSAMPYWVTTQLPKFLHGNPREVKPHPDAYGDEEPEDIVPRDKDGLDNEGKTQIYWEHLMEYEQTQLRKVYSHHMAQQYPPWNELVAASTLKIDFLKAVMLCADEFHVRGIERWIDIVNGGQFPRLYDTLRRPGT
ncbi:altered inheritance of mitochondria mitochondrial [Fusarium heterosporum]|uniref:Altered inheritance of mitochondria mitochondrial n=1 Tax=Fusarium heterosporum TaxID=42747 RepID=A0A8H5TCJ2_FUSHE|nr:altered inheritance of mitochondria mitochondrial [Fusarium heterosporum]